MAKNDLLYNFRNNLKKHMGGRDKLYPFMEYNTADIVKVVDDDFIIGIDAAAYRYGSIASGTSAAVTGSVASTANGICRLTSGTSNGGYVGIFPNYGASLKGAVCRGDLSPVFWVRLKVSAVTTIKIEAGFTDADDDAGGAVNSTSGATATATNAALWVFDTDDAGNSTCWQGFTAIAGAVAKVEPTKTAIGAATYEWLGVAMQDQAVKFMHADQYGNPDYESAWQAATCTETTALVPWIYIINRAGTASRTLDIDRWLVWQRRVATDS
jgi:hypothetical protein